MPDIKLHLMSRSSEYHTANDIRHGEHLLGYAISGLFVSCGLGLIAGFMANDAVLGAGICGALLIVSAVLISISLEGKSRQVLKRSPNDTDLLRSLANNIDSAVLVTNTVGELVASNDSYEQMGAERRRPVASFLDKMDSDKLIKSMLKDIIQHGSWSETFPSIRHDFGDLRIQAEIKSSYILWKFKPLAANARAKTIIASLRETIEPIVGEMNLGLALVSSSGDLLHANEKLRSWLQLRDGQPLPVKLRLKDHSTRLVIDEETIHDVQVFKHSVPADIKDEPFGHVLILRDLKGFAGARLKDKTGRDIIDPLVDAAPIGVVVVDEEGKVEDVNQSMILFGQSLGFPNYTNIFDIIKNEAHAEFQKMLNKVSQGQVIRRPYDVRFKGETDKVGQFYFSSIKTEDKRFIVLYMIDTSHQKSIEKQFVQAQKMQAVGQLAGGVAHDFNNLLTAIIGFCDLSLARHEAGDTTFSDLMNIKQNANRASNLVRQLLAFSRQQTLRPKVLSISDVIAELSNLVRRLIGENITLDIKHGRDLSSVKVDQGQLEQVIINLAVNAKDAMPNGGTLTISTRTLKSNDPLLDQFEVIVPSDYVLIELRDTGTGIDEKYANKIFEPFFTTKDIGKGTGLGLATVYGIVKQTGGYVFFDSEVGKGTNFMIFLKAYEGEVEIDEDVAELPTKDLTGQGTILLVEDEDAVRLFTSRALTNKGYKVIQASSGEEGLELFKQNAQDIELLITDVIMPVMDGPTLVKALKEMNKDLKVIFISGYAEDIVRKDMQDDTCHFLPKPFSLVQLAESVKTVLS